MQVHNESPIIVDARLALQLVDQLMSAQHEESGGWGNRLHHQPAMRESCHALEALHMLGWDFLDDLIEQGVVWLVNLSDQLDEEEGRTIRLHPSRFKTLAWLNHFDDRKILDEFSELGDSIEDDQVRPTLPISATLAQMIYLDSLDWLERHGRRDPNFERRRKIIVDELYRVLERWVESKQGKDVKSQLAHEGDASYALHLLLTDGKLLKRHPLCREVFDHLLANLEEAHARPLQSHHLYTLIQLASHFGERQEVERAVRRLLDTLHHRLRNEPAGVPDFPALILRALLTFHQGRLQRQMHSELLKQQRSYMVHRQEQRDQRLERSFQTILRNRFDVDIEKIEPLSGGISKAEVFRVHYCLTLDGGRTHGDRASTNDRMGAFTPPSLVIKRDSVERLRQSVRSFRELPEPIRTLFARHAAEPQILNGDLPTSGYLILEDLTEMQTLRQLFDPIDQRMVSNRGRKRIESACSTVLQGLFTIYGATFRPARELYGAQLSRLFLSRIEEALIEAIRPNRHPRLKVWYQGFRLANHRYPSIDHYLNRLERFKAELRLPGLMLVHGDCHSRNIMLNQATTDMKLIDLDRLNPDGDYIFDVAQLLEDVALFRFLFIQPDTAAPYARLRSEQILFEEPGGTNIDFPPLQSEATRFFQQEVMRRVALYAEEIGDALWQERLWLALTVWLLELSEKHGDVNFATVLYVEAVKLLDGLVEHLERGVELPEIPFGGRHGRAVEQDSAEDALKRAGFSYLGSLHREITMNVAGLRTEHSRHTLRYMYRDNEQPLAMLLFKQSPPVLLLPAETAEIEDPQGLIIPWSSGGAFRSAIRLSEELSEDSIVTLLQSSIDSRP